MLNAGFIGVVRMLIKKNDVDGCVYITEMLFENSDSLITESK